MAANTPIQQFGGSTQRALEEFRLEYNTSLASQPRVWAEELGDMLTGDSLKDTYPVALDVQKYREKSGEPEASTILSKDITVIKREFYSSAVAEARRIKRGDFAYIKAWARKPEAMANARVFLRNHLIADLLNNGKTALGFDGQPFFSATHPVNPFKPTLKFAGSATWSNLESTATELNATELTKQKNIMKRVPGPDGEELGQEVTHILVPTILDDTAYNLLSVQDLLLSGALDGAGGGQMGTIRNPHINSGLQKIRSPELPGATAAADWYLISASGANAGMFPWVLSEDASEEIVTWGEESDFYKDTKSIKVESSILLEAAYLFPHAIRRITGKAPTP